MPEQSRPNRTIDEASAREDKLNELAILKQALEEQKQQTQQYYDQLLRLRAEFENYKKRAEKQRAELIDWGQNQLIINLLPLLDDLEKAKALIDENRHSAKISSGLKLIYKKFWDVLKKEGLESQEVVGKKFDPQLHHAALQVESTDHPEGEIIEEIQRGYLLGNRIIRPALVKVAKKPRDKSQKPKAEN